MPIAEELDLPLAMKFGAMRGVNPWDLSPDACHLDQSV